MLKASVILVGIGHIIVYFSTHGCSCIAISFSRILHSHLIHDSCCFAIQHSVAVLYIALVAVTGRLKLLVAFYDISLIIRSVAELFRQLFKLIFVNCVLFQYFIAVRAYLFMYVVLSSHP